ncbi:MAG: class II glutamine amidotransferase [Parafannyhessea sp.]|uniref:class II glutamine amidotransferase n=1 Tax=Parafannyhessea sp. TaxID=2847324 RepID=UPI003F0559DE
MMLAIDTSKPIVANELLSSLFSHGNEHPEGWGLTYLPAGDEGRPATVREPKNAAVSERVQAILREPVETAHLIAHIRKASVGSARLENCHPFGQDDHEGREWELAHNGTMFEPRATKPFYAQREGTTDSEAILPYLVEASDTAVAQGADESGRIEAIDRAIQAIAPGNKLNLLFGDGTHTYAYTNDANKTLWRLRLDDGWAFATAPLDGRAWEPMQLCQLQAVHDGEMDYEGTPGTGVFTSDNVEYLRMLELMSA